MQTFYIDVYFLMNFTVDVSALYFATSFSKVPTCTWRLILASFVGAIYAVIHTLFLKNLFVIAIVSIFTLILMILIATTKISFFRKLKFLVSFLIFEILIGGIVYYCYCLLDSLMSNVLWEKTVAENQKLLIVSVVVLLAMGILRLLQLLFSKTHNAKSANIVIEFWGRSIDVEALLDSGNFAVDPFDKTPVVFIKETFLNKYFSFSDDFLENVKNDINTIGKSFRLIPVKIADKNKLYYGFKPDAVYVGGDSSHRVSVTVAIDKDSGTYAGYFALAPSSAVEDL